MTPPTCVRRREQRRGFPAHETAGRYLRPRRQNSGPPSVCSTSAFRNRGRGIARIAAARILSFRSSSLKLRATGSRPHRPKILSQSRFAVVVRAGLRALIDHVNRAATLPCEINSNQCCPDAHGKGRQANTSAPPASGEHRAHRCRLLRPGER